MKICLLIMAFERLVVLKILTFKICFPFGALAVLFCVLGSAQFDRRPKAE